MKIKTSAVTFLFIITYAFCYAQIDNEELTAMYEADQADRQMIGNGDVDMNFVTQMLSRDSARLVRVYQLINANTLKTGQDYYHAGMICQHGHDFKDSRSALSMMRKAIELDSTVNKWLLAAAIDRDLVRSGKPQIYGTQFYKDENNVWSQLPMDTTVVSDEERKKFHVETLKEQKEKLKQFNKISLFTLSNYLKDIDKLISFCRKEWLMKDQSKYNLSETEINDLGYSFMAQGQFDNAYKIFILNTDFYPNGFNTYDSLGECLLKLGKRNEARAAYKKSLDLNPQNQNARTVLSKL